MKQLYTFLIAVAMSSTALAQEPFTRSNGQAQPNPKQMLATPLCQLAQQNGKPMKALKKAGELADIIYDQPEGTLYHHMYGYKQGYYNFLYYWYANENDADADEIVVTDDALYLKNPVSNYPDCVAWIKGTKTEGDTIAFEFPQKVFEETVSGKHYNYCLYRMVQSESKWVLDETTQTVKFVWRNDSLIKTETESLMGLCSEDGSTWTYYGDNNVVICKLNEQTVAPQDPSKAKQYKMAYTVDGESSEKVVKLAIEGSDAYLGAFANNQPEAWAKGRVENGNIVFNGRTYLGVDESERCHTWFIPATTTTITYPNGYSYNDYAETDQLTLTYDAAADTYTSDGSFIVNIGKNSISAWEVFTNPELTTYEEHAGQPEKPELVGYQPYDESEGYGGIRFNLSKYSTDGYYLNPGKLFYRIYFDMEPYTFEYPEYMYMQSAMTDIPYAYDDGYDFRVSGDQHTVYYYRNDFETIGVAAFYKDDDMTYPSTLVYLNTKNIDGISGVTENHGEVVSTTYTDLSGRAVTLPQHGIYIKTLKMADGTTRSTKTVVK